MNTIISIDIETTGLDIYKDRIVEIAAVMFDGETTTKKHTLVNPGIPIPAAASEIHGIFDNHVADKPTFKRLARSILEFIDGTTILTYNGNQFDMPLLYAEFNRAGIEWNYQQNTFIDACAIFKRKEPRDLTAAMKFYCNSTPQASHSALGDALDTLKVFAEQLRRYYPDEKGTAEIALYSNYDAPRIDMAGWFDANLNLAKGKSKGTQDAGFLKWMLKLDDLFPDARRIAQKILDDDKRL